MGKLGLGGVEPLKRFVDRGSETRFTIPGWNSGIIVIFSQTSHIIYCIPILITETRTFDRMGIEVDTAGASGDLARLGVYSSKSNNSGLTPDALLLDAGTTLVDTTGDKLITISLTLGPGYYFLAFVAQGGLFSGVSDSGAVSTPVTGVSISVNEELRRFVPISAVDAGADYPANGLPNPALAIDTGTTSSAAIVRLRDSS